MGNSMPPPASFDLVDSVARRRGDTVELHLADPKFDDVADGAPFWLQKGSRRVEGHGELNAGSITVRVPRTQLADGIWTISLVGADGAEAQQLQARLLVQGERPLVLLWGAKVRPSVEPRVANTPARRAAATGGQVIDQALSLIAPERAVALRGSARRTARRVLG